MKTIWKGHLKEVKEQLPYTVRWHLKEAIREALMQINNEGGLFPSESRMAKLTTFPAAIKISDESVEMFIGVYEVINDDEELEKFKLDYQMGYKMDIEEVGDLIGEDEDEQEEIS